MLTQNTNTLKDTNAKKVRHSIIFVDTVHRFNIER